MFDVSSSEQVRNDQLRFRVDCGPGPKVADAGKKSQEKILLLKKSWPGFKPAKIPAM